MKLYIPELGDQLKLLEDWTFPLHAESRNSDLAKMKGLVYSYRGQVWTTPDNLPAINAVKYNQVNMNDFRIGELPVLPSSTGGISYRYHYDNRPIDQIAYSEAVKAATMLFTMELAKFGGDRTINITIPKDSILKVDRIYIRKGASLFSSITFYTDAFKNPDTGKKKAYRFWAKLSDCYNIEFEKINTEDGTKNKK